MENTRIKKTISLPKALAERLEAKAKKEHRTFSNLLVKDLTALFLPSTVIQSKKGDRK